MAILEVTSGSYGMASLVGALDRSENGDEIEIESGDYEFSFVTVRPSCL
jgi:hypothetical protein